MVPRLSRCCLAETKDWFDQFRNTKVNDSGPDTFAYLYSSLENYKISPASAQQF